ALARLAFPTTSGLPELAAGLLAFIPQFTFLHAYITNDGLANLAGALGLWTLARVIYAPDAPDAGVRRAWLLAGLAASLTLVVKMTAWFVLPLAGLLLLDRWRRGLRSGAQTGGDLATWLAALCMVPVLVGLIWPDFAARLLNAPHTGGIRPDYATLEHLWGLAPMTHASFWGRFGWVNVPVPRPLPWALDAIWAVGLGGVVYGVARAGRALDRIREARRGPMFWQILWLCLAACGFVFILFIGFNLTVMQPQGRFFYPAVAAPVLWVAWGWSQWLGAGRGSHRGLGVVLLLGLLVGINLWGLCAGLGSAYWG
ncbi:MAG: hypothetical protein WDZ49_05105, partial [Litorilinea sp.]